MFQLRNFDSIALGMINHAKATQTELTDFNIGSAGRTLLEASAIEIDEFYQRMLAGILEAIPTAVYNAFSFPLRLSAYARGSVVIAFSVPLAEPVTVPAGTVFSNPAANTRYLSEAAVTAQATATSLAVIVKCSVAGSSGNTGANTITQAIGYTLPNTATIGNGSIDSGTDGETDAERMNRFNEFIDSLVRGTPSAVAHAARHMALYDPSGNITEYVSRIGYAEEMGWAGLYVYCGGGKPSSDMLQAIQTALDGYVTPDGVFIPGYRPCGIKVDIVAMTERLIDISLQVRKFPGGVNQAIQNGIATALGNLFDAAPNNSTVFLSQITAAALAVSGVRECYIKNTENPTIGSSDVLKLGNLTIEWMN